MKIAFGLKAHSGWAALVAIGRPHGHLAVTDRRRIVLVEEAWQKHAYHAARKLAPEAAHDRVARAVATSRRLASRELRAAVKQQREAGHDVSMCALLAGGPMPGWSLEEIVAVHFRMHQAEGVLFRDALARGAASCGLNLMEIPEKTLTAQAAESLGTPAPELLRIIAALRAEAGPPWGKDQKDAALAALLALSGNRSGRPGSGTP